ncbi:MAG: hypothetical protein P8X82_04845 [Gemmatimonadales bacterium]|jgi:hypothetical protein
MDDHVTLLRPDAPRADSQRIPSALAPDLAAKLRGRVKVLALLVALGFGIGPVIFLAVLVASLVLGTEPPGNIGQASVFLWIQPGAVGISLALWWRARDPRVHATQLLRLGLLYQAAICFIIGVSSYWSQYGESGQVPRPKPGEVGPMKVTARGAETAIIGLEAVMVHPAAHPCS